MTLAWSEVFEPNRLGPVVPVGLPAAITAEWAWGSSTGVGVRVAVVDSGVDAAHPAVRHVAGSVALSLREDGEVEVVEGPHEDLFGHGTACAAIIRSLAPDVELWSVRVLGRALKGKGSVFAAGVSWCIEHGMDVVNLSLSSRSPAMKLPLHDLADEAAFRDVLLVCAANNVPAPSYPSTFSPVFSVAAIATDDPEHYLVNPSPPVEFGARGVDLEVAWLDGTTVTSTGNSFATPHIAGLLARLRGRHPGLTVAEAKTVLRALAANSTTMGT